MNSLAQQQSDLLSVLLAPESHAHDATAPQWLQDPQGRGIKAYRSNGRMLAERALRAAYPAIAASLGSATFANLARAHWHAMPPSQGDIGRWGGELAAFIEGSPALADTPWLADLAHAQWALHICAGAADAAADPASFALLEHSDPGYIGMHMAPGLQGVRSIWPIAQLLTRYQRAPDASPLRGGLTIRHSKQSGQAIVVWRLGWEVRWRESTPLELDALELMAAGARLDDLTQRISDAALQTWMTQWVQEGILLGLVRIPQEHTP